MRVLLPGSNRKPYTIYRVLKPIDNVAASKIMPLLGEFVYSERGLRTEEYCCQDEHLAILYFINRLSKMLKFSFE